MSRTTALPQRPFLPTLRRALAAVAATGLVVGLAACSSTPSDDPTGDAGDGGTAPQLRLGLFANVTHAPAIVGLTNGLFEAELGDTELTTQIFNAGPSAIEALNAGAIDASFIGPNPAINGFVQSRGEALRIVGGSTSGGAQLIVQPEINSPADLAGKNIATPQLGQTQDVALRTWLADEGYETNISGGGDVTITPTENAQALQLFQDGQIDGAWVPEPWASRLVLDAGGKVLVDERDLWEDGWFVTTHIIVAADYLERYPDTVEALLRGALAAQDWIADNPDEVPSLVNTKIEEVTTRALSEDVLERAFTTLTFTKDPLARTLATSYENAIQAGTSQEGSIEGIYDLRILNALLRDRGEDPVSSAGLGQE